MYDLSEELNTFFSDHVELSQDKIDELFKKKDYNIDRLERGLSKYNDENSTNYSLEESYVQGSVGMDTVTQNEENDYDIDVGILIDEEDIDNAGSGKIKNVILNAFEQINAKFITPPQKLTNCIRFTYKEGYQIDFAVYREVTNAEHAGSEWRERSPEAIQGWFDLSKLIVGEKLPQVIQLLKMFNKSSSSWKMPGGLITTILVEESLANQYTRTDEVLYYTIENMVDRLNRDEDVKSPIFPNPSILYTEKDKERVKILKTRLEKYLDKLSVLVDEDCTRLDAIEAWQSFFSHSYWDELQSGEEQNEYDSRKTAAIGEEYIHQKYPIRLKYNLEIDATVDMDGFRNKKIIEFLKLFSSVPKGKKIEFFIVDTDTPKPYDIYWKVRNVGPEAYKRNMIRGQIGKRNQRKINEPASFSGPHYVECYIVKDGICVAKKRVDVPI